MTEVPFKNARMETGQLIIDIPPEHRGTVMKWLRDKKDALYTVALKLFTKKRSNNANAYFWSLASKVAASMHCTKEEVYRQYIPDVQDNFVISTVPEGDVARYRQSWSREGLGWITEVIGPSANGKVDIMCYYGSSFYDTKQMSRLISLAQDECSALGIPIADPGYVESLLAQWE